MEIQTAAAAGQQAQSSMSSRMQEAWSKACSGLSEQEKAVFESHACKPGSDGLSDYLKAIDSACESHRKESVALRAAEWFGPLYKAVELVMPVVAAATSAYPPAVIVLGGVVGVLQSMKNIDDLQSETIGMLAQMAWQSNALLEWDRSIYADEEPVQVMLIQVYADILSFCGKAFRTVPSKTDNKVRMRVKGFRRMLFKSYGDHMDTELSAFKTHMAELKWRAKNCDKRRLKESRELQGRHDELLHRQINEWQPRAEAMLQQLVKKDREDRGQGRIAPFGREDTEQAYLWLSSYTSLEDYDKQRKVHLEGTGNWLLESPDFIDWRDGPASDVLWIKGKPGCGKSVLAAVSIKHLSASRKGQEACAFAFCRKDLDTMQSVSGVLAMLAGQLVDELACQLTLDEADTLYDTLKAQYRSSKYGAVPPNIDQAMKILESIMRQSKRTFLVVDGLDECKEAEALVKKLLHLVQHESPFPIKILFLSRPESTLTKVLKPYTIICPDDGTNNADLQLYVDDVFADGDDPEENEVNATIRGLCGNKADGMFLWVKLLAEHVNPIRPPSLRLEMIRDTFPDLGELYDRMLREIWETRGELVKTKVIHILVWVTQALSPLGAAEIWAAMRASDEQGAIRVDSAPDPEDLVTLCSNLVFHDNAGILRLCHESVRDYLDSFKPAKSQTISAPLLEYRRQRDLAHDLLAESCLAYLLSSSLIGPASSAARLEVLYGKHVFLKYAGTFWGEHLRNSNSEATAAMAKRLLSSPSRRNLAMQVMLSEYQGITELWRPSNVSVTLHLLAFYGLDALAESLAPTGDISHEPDSSGRTPLWYAFAGKHEQIATWLIDNATVSIYCASEAGDKSTYVHQAANLGWSNILEKLLSDSRESSLLTAAHRLRESLPLATASAQGHVEAMAVLIRAGAELDTISENDSTPLIAAIRAEQVGSVKKLLEAGALPNCTDADGVTPLHWAAEKANAVLTRLLLNKGADPSISAASASDQLPLHIAAENNAVEVIEILHQACPSLLDAKCKGGYTALHVTAFHDSCEAAMMLVNLGSNPREIDDTGTTPLYIAAREGSTRTALALVDKPYDINRVMELKQTLLHVAAERGDSQILAKFKRKALLSRSPKQLVNLPNTIGDTALHLVIERGDMGMVETLIDLQADPMGPGRLGAYPLHFAAHYNRTDISQFLLARTKSPNLLDSAGNTPLIFATRVKNLGFIKTFFADCANLGLKIDINAQNESGRTALHIALSVKAFEIAQLLLDEGAISLPESDGNYPIHNAAWDGFVSPSVALYEPAHIAQRGWAGRTPLLIAALRGHEDMVQTLFNIAPQVLNTADDDGATPVMRALQRRHLNIVNFLLDNGADPNMKNDDKESLMHMAAQNGDLSIVKRLFEAGCQPDHLDWYNESPFFKAVSGDRLEVVDYMGSKGLVNPLAVNALEDMPHMVAASNGSLEMLTLLEGYAIPPYGSRNRLGRTAAYKAAEGGYWHVLDYLRGKGESLETADFEGNTPLEAAVWGGSWGAVDHLLQLLPGSDINKVINPFERKTLTSIAASRRLPSTFKLLLARGGDAEHRDGSCVRVVDYASKCQLCLPALQKFRPSLSLAEDADQTAAITMAFRACCDALLQLPEELSTKQMYFRISRIVQMGNMLLRLNDLEAFKRCLMECIWRPRAMLIGITFTCAICARTNLQNHVMVCTACYSRPELCKECYDDYAEEGKQAPGALKQVNTLEKSLLSLRRAMSTDTENVFVFYDAIQRSPVAVAKVAELTKQYKAWDRSYNAMKRYSEFPMPGKKLLELLEDIEEVITDGENEEEDVQLEKIKKIANGDRELRLKHKTDRERPEFACHDHEYLPITSEEQAKLKLAGEDLDSETGRLTTTFVKSMLAKYPVPNCPTSANVAESRGSNAQPPVEIKLPQRAATFDISPPHTDTQADVDLAQAVVETGTLDPTRNVVRQTRIALKRAQTLPIIPGLPDQPQYTMVLEAAADVGHTEQQWLENETNDGIIAEPDTIDSPLQATRSSTDTPLDKLTPRMGDLTVQAEDEHPDPPPPPETQAPEGLELAEISDIDISHRAWHILCNGDATSDNIKQWVLSIKITNALLPDFYEAYVRGCLDDDMDEDVDDFLREFYEERIRID